MEGRAVQGHVNIDAAVGPDEADLLDIALAELENLGVSGDQPCEIYGNVLCGQLLLFQHKHQIIDEVVLAVELKVVKEHKFAFCDNGKIKAAAIDVDIHIGLFFVRILFQDGVQEDRGAMGDLHISPKLSDACFLLR